MSRFKEVNTISDEDNVMRRLTVMEERFDSIMPLDPDYDPALCRDAFLRQVFAELNWSDDADESDSLSKRKSSRFSLSEYKMRSRLSVGSFIRRASRIVKTSRVVDRMSIHDIQMDNTRLNTMLGQSDAQYQDLLESIQHSSVYYVFSRIINRLRIMHSIALDYGSMSENEVPHNLFKWSMADFFKRCELPDPVYLDVLSLNYSYDALDWVKFSTDLLETLRYYKYFYQQIYEGAGIHKTMAVLWDQQQLLNIGEELDKNLQLAQATFMAIEARGRVITRRLEDVLKDYKVTDCSQLNTDPIIRLPIEWRYIRDTYATLTEMQIMKDNEPLTQAEKEIESLERAIQDDRNLHITTVTANELIMQNYHQRLIYYTEKLNDDWEHWELQVTVAKMRLTKMQEDLISFQEKREFMRQRTAEVRALIAEEDQAHFDQLIFGTEQKHVSWGKENRRKLKGKGKDKRIRPKDTPRPTTFEPL